MFTDRKMILKKIAEEKENDRSGICGRADKAVDSGDSGNYSLIAADH